MMFGGAAGPANKVAQSNQSSIQSQLAGRNTADGKAGKSKDKEAVSK